MDDNDPADTNIDASIEVYQAQFDDLPTIIGIPPNKMAEVGKALDAAVAADEPLTDNDLYEAIGMEPPPEGAVV